MNPAPRVLPILRLAVLCESISTDADGRPYNLFVPVHTMRFPSGNVRRFRPPTLNIYVQLGDARGTFYIRVALRREGGIAELYESLPVEVVFGGDAGSTSPLELAIELDELVFPSPGIYEIVVYANHLCLHEPAQAVPIPFPPIRVILLPADGSPGGVE